MICHRPQSEFETTGKVLLYVTVRENKHTHTQGGVCVADSFPSSFVSIYLYSLTKPLT